jgi:regulator of sigma E protease
MRNYALAILGVGLIIGIHELGHFSFCKLFGIKTPTFSIGFGPSLYQKKIYGTTFRLALFPIGGYVEIAGMDASIGTNKEGSFDTKPYYQKALVILGGVIFNFLFTIITFLLLNARYMAYLLRKKLEERGYQAQGLIGPIGIIVLIAQSAGLGASFYFFFLAIISANLGFFNLFPLPILDGGQLMVTTIEAIQGAPLSNKAESALTITMILIFLAMLFYASRRNKKSASSAN